MSPPTPLPPLPRAPTTPPPPVDAEAPNTAAADPAPGESAAEPGERGIGDFVRRAVSAGFEAATRSKDDILRVATSEIRSWLDRMDLDKELMKALSKMTIEVKAEVRFRPNADGQIVGTTSSPPEISIKTSGEPGKP